MKLAATDKVRTIVEVLYNISEQLQNKDIDVPLTKVHAIKKITLVVITGDHGLYGSFDDYTIKKAESCLNNHGLVPSLPSTDEDDHLPVSSFLFYHVPKTHHPRSHSFSPHFDVYSLCVLLPLLTGKTPFQDLVEKHYADIPWWVHDEEKESGEASGGVEGSSLAEKRSPMLVG
ncbi:hypothetical protein COCNU_07G002060 [Cocos nucifera]|uniref:Uncharacterized protein n=1 Tax=Cocos nucifera TaxID=13894 RepID=A0A8K0N4V6_COCNU|nr:hypothetical protein COCNU_07G002060 [Cocos nucifera]